MDNFLSRTELLIGKENLEKLKQAHVAVFGCGGVGSYAIEALVRSGIGSLTIVDHDVVDITNINRQLIADTTTIGKPKVEIEKERLLRINPDLNLFTYQEFYEASKADKYFSTSYDYIIDAIDCISAKLSLVKEATNRSIPIISCTGTGNKLDASKFQITDIRKTSVCPLAKVVRRELKKRGIENLKVLFSTEEPHRAIVQESNARTPASISFVPSVAGLLIAGEVIRDLVKD